MVRIKSKILSLLLASAMSLSVMPGVTAFAAETRGDTLCRKKYSIWAMPLKTL